MISFLYPRLLAGQATPIYTEYHGLSIRELTERTAFAHESAVYVATGGDRVSVEGLRELRAGVIDLAAGAGFPDDSDRLRNAEFDLALAAFLHGEMGMVPAEAAARDVWAFLALIVLPDVSFWRYPRPPKDRILGTDLTRHVFGRLWWRAQLVRSHDTSEPYGALEILGEAAFDQIYARRAALGGSPHMVRSILRVWNDLDLQGLNERETLRDFLKRLLRLAPFVLFDGVGEAALDDELRAVAEESLVAQRRTVAPAGIKTELGSVAQRTPPEERKDRAAPSGPTSESAEAPTGTEQIVEPRLRSVEVCAGCGAQALGLERAGFDPVLLVDSKQDACSTIKANRPNWDVVCMDIAEFRVFKRQDVIGVDLLSGGLPRVKSSASGGRDEDTDERAVLRATINLARVIRPKAVLLENVPDLVESPHFEADRLWIAETLATAGYGCYWAVLNAADFGVPQNRRSGFLVALQEPYRSRFAWPLPVEGKTPLVGQVLKPSMSARGWPGAEGWAKRAHRLAPALVGGSDRRGGADLGPTGSKRAWEALGVDGSSLGNEPPGPDFPVGGLPKLTVEQAALVQSIPEGWLFNGGKTSRYRQIGHAMPPPLATAVGQAVAAALRG
ncbi:DUF6339 family protein [Streptomyces sp. NPDC001741]|uniref:DNA cytosine methyltransferase n=1 Tax=Streptomyces sp. NPDC001741 TaxID=3364605 RepID=UPI0036C7BAC5